MLITVLKSKLVSIPLHNFIELQRVVFCQREFGLPPEDSAAIHLSILPHRLSGLLFKETVISQLGQHGEQTLGVMVCLHFLKTDNVPLSVVELLENDGPAVGPRETPRIAVGIGLPDSQQRRGKRADMFRGIDFSQNIVTDETKSELRL